MKLRIMSDLHIEHHADKGKSFGDIPPEDTDILVLAGDIADIWQIKDVLGMFCDLYPKVLYVPGNHEFCGSGLNDGWKVLDSIKRNNLHILRRGIVTIEGKRFLGATLWYRKNPLSAIYEKYMIDFNKIKDAALLYEEGEKDYQFFLANMRKGDICISHHMPTEMSVSPRWKGNKLNMFFVNELGGTIDTKEPEFWIHGHTHDPQDYMLGKTRILCAPFGYINQKNNAHIDIQI